MARLTCGEVTCYHNRNRPTLTMLQDIANGTKSVVVNSTESILYIFYMVNSAGDLLLFSLGLELVLKNLMAHSN